MNETSKHFEEIKKLMEDRFNEQQKLVQKLLLESQLHQKELMTLDDVVDYTDSSRSQIYKLSANKKIPHYCPNGKKLYFKRSEVDQWIFSNKQTSKDEITQQAEEYLAKKVRR